MRADEMIGEIAVAMAGGVSAWLLGDTLHPYPTVSELVRWTADQIGKQREEEHFTSARARQQPGSSAPAVVSVHRGATQDPIRDEQVAQVRELRAGYGQADAKPESEPAA